MRKKLKKLLSCVLCFFLAANTFSLYVFSYNVGDVTGKILSTDIVTFVEGVKVRSYNINGRTAIITQDLNKLGEGLNFGVSFDEESRTLSLTDKDIFMTGQKEALIFNESASSLPIGSPVGNVYFTDITTNFEGTPLESFNIGGLTCIYSDDLAKLCGTYVWDDTARTVNVWRKNSYIPSITKKESLKGLNAKDSALKYSDTVLRWGESSSSYLTENSDSSFTAVSIDEHVNIENYDSSFNLISSFAIKKELELVGTVLFGKDYNYIVFGQENLLEDNSREVIRIVIYDKSFVKISEVSINNCKTSVPFDASGASLCEDDNYLVLHTSRSQYLDEKGNRPQSQLTVIVDKKTWSPVNVLGKFQYNHTSHALRGFVKSDNGKIVTANLSDAAPIRGAFLQEMDFSGKVLKTQSIFNAGGTLAANCTGIMIGGLESSEKGYFVPMNTIDHSLATGYSSINIDGIEKERRDVYLLWTDKETSDMRHTCLARYSGTTLSGSVPYIINLENGYFMVLWQVFNDASEESNSISYAFFDSSGNQISSRFSVNGVLSKDCQPILSQNRVVWYVNTPMGRDFYSLSADITALTAPKEETSLESSDKETLKQEQENREEKEEEKEKITEVDGI